MYTTQHVKGLLGLVKKKLHFKSLLAATQMVETTQVQYEYSLLFFIKNTLIYIICFQNNHMCMTKYINGQNKYRAYYLKQHISPHKYNYIYMCVHLLSAVWIILNISFVIVSYKGKLDTYLFELSSEYTWQKLTIL